MFAFDRVLVCVSYGMLRCAHNAVTVKGGKGSKQQKRKDFAGKFCYSNGVTSVRLDLFCVVGPCNLTLLCARACITLTL